MKANEFRIGNYVFLKSKSKIYQILSGQEIDTGTDSEDFDPIPLTEEWLVKFGFKNKEKGNFSFNENMDLRIFGDEADYNGIWVSRIQYVHQLQNLFFALTGEELEMHEG